MSFNNANLPSVSNLLAITTKNVMEKRISQIDKSECLYPINKNIKNKYNKLINKKAINICEGRLNYIKLRKYSYEIKYYWAANGDSWLNKRLRYSTDITNRSADAKEQMINWANGDDCGITSMKKKIEKQKDIIKKYEEYLNKLFWWNKAIDNKDTDKKKVNKYKKHFKQTVVGFLWIVEKWNAKQKNSRMEFMRPDITHANGRMKIRRKIIEEFERNIRTEKFNSTYLFREYANLSHIKKTVEKLENGFLNAKYNPKTKLGYKFMNDLYDENF